MSALQYAQQHLGVHEIKDRKALQNFFTQHGYGRIDPKTLAWCSAYANSVLEATGHASISDPSGGAAAGAFLKDPRFKPATAEDVESGYGTYLGIVKGQSPRTKQEGTHVGILTGETRINPRTGELEYQMRGGNQPEADDQGKPYSGEGVTVSDMWFPASKLHLRAVPRNAAEIEQVTADTTPTESKPVADTSAPPEEDDSMPANAMLNSGTLDPAMLNGDDTSFKDRFGDWQPPTRLTQEQRDALWQLRADQEATRLGEGASGKAPTVVSDDQLWGLISDLNPYGKAAKFATGALAPLLKRVEKTSDFVGKSSDDPSSPVTDLRKDKKQLERDLGIESIGTTPTDDEDDPEREAIIAASNAAWADVDEEVALQEVDDEAIDEDEVSSMEEQCADEEAIDNRQGP